jgi:hypothetical protein
VDDKTLLELAAKAAGMKINFTAYDDFGIFDEVREEYWNPLTDDGDALRLAVKLDLFFMTDNVGLHEARDDIAATRRAIVRAAAKIGKELK